MDDSPADALDRPRSWAVRRPAASASPVFAVAIGASAFLLFTLEPMVGRVVLPIYGGAPAVWATVLMFFQVVLLLGYLYAHAVATRLSPTRGAALHVAVVGVAVLAVVLGPRAAMPMGDGGIPTAVAVVLTIGVLIGPAAFVMTATTPLLSAWYARVRRAADPEAAGGDPYWLYALSNGGSLVSLLAYPLVIEPRLGLTVQRTWWSIGFVGLAVLVTLAAVALRSVVRVPVAVADPTLAAEGAAASASVAAAPPTRRARLRWLALAAIPAGLLSAVTNLVTTDLIAAPLLWVVPLAAYLASFVVAFSARGRRTLVPACIALASVALTLLWLPMGSSAGWPVGPLLAIEYAGFAVVAIALHGRLAQLRPDERHLTGFYLVMSAGGALGGAFVALIAPLTFKGVWEYPLLIVAAVAALAALAPVERDRRRPLVAMLGGAPRRMAPYALVVLPLLAIMAGSSALGLQAAARWALVGGLVLLVGGVPRLFAAATTLVLVLATLVLPPAALFRDRSFFGEVEVTRDATMTLLFHGTTVHGLEWVDPARRADPAGYYARTGPVGDLFSVWDVRPAGRIRVTGLGAGTLALFARPGDDLGFFEIDPLVARVAQDARLFTYLADRASPTTVRIGDGRLLLAAEPDRSVGLVILDAFSSDAVPAHLLTLEAMADADRVLTSDGILAVHVSNRYYDLAPPVAAALRSLGMTVLDRLYVPSPGEAAKGAGISHFLAATRDPTAISGLVSRGWVPAASGGTPLTDDFPDLLRYLHL